MKPPGPPPTELAQLVRAEDRLSFLYLERCTVHRDGNALTAQDERGTMHVPLASLGAVLLGPGTRVTHQAMMLLSDSGATAVWVGEQGVRYYAHGRGLTSSSRLLEAQAAAVTNQSSRLRVAREMYAMRFGEEDVSGLTMQQLRGREGARVKRAYRAAAESAGVEWRKRSYDPTNFATGDPLNQALSAATTCLYGVCHAVIVALGCSPGLGFVHVGDARSFVYDVADLYKVELAVPTAFEVAAEFDESDDIGGITRRRMREVIHASGLLRRCSRDIHRLLADPGGEEVTDVAGWNVIELWDGGTKRVSGGRSWSDEVDVPW